MCSLQYSSVYLSSFVYQHNHQSTKIWCHSFNVKLQSTKQQQQHQEQRLVHHYNFYAIKARSCAYY